MARFYVLLGIIFSYFFTLQPSGYRLSGYHLSDVLVNKLGTIFTDWVPLPLLPLMFFRLLR